MILRPREYQDYAVSSVWDYFKAKTGNPLIAMPTGTGKSVVIAMLAESMLRAYPTTRIQVLTHVKELIEQNYEKFLMLWPQAPAGIFSAGLKRKDTANNVIFGGIASVHKLAHLFGHVDILMIDEAHLVNPKEATMYNNYIAALRVVNPLLKVIGLTATPWRMGHGSIIENGLFTDICCDMTGIDAFTWLIEQGYLLPLVPAKIGFQLDTKGVTLLGGEFNSAKLQVAVNKRDITMRAIRRTLELAGDRKHWLIFASGVEHAKDIADILTTEFDIPCEAVYTGMGDGERDRVIREFKSGKLRAVVNNNILTTGFDYPELDLIICLRPTMSPVLWVQMLGRGTRPVFIDGFDISTLAGRLASIAASDKQNCMVLDFAANAKRLGPINDPVIPRKKGEGKGEAPVKECDTCGVENHARAAFCGGKPHPHQMSGYCGAAFSFAVKILPDASTTELIAKSVLPIIEVMAVETVSYSAMHRSGRPAMLSVAYHSGINMVKEVVCFDHPEGNYARVKAEGWWKRRSPSPIPRSVMEAVEFINSVGIAAPSHLRVQTNSKFPDIMAYDFSGTAFGTVTAKPVVVVPPAPGYDPAEQGIAVTDFDDIPF